MSKRDPKLLVEDIVESAQKILDYTESLTFEQFTSDSKTIDAVIRNFEIIGEAGNRLPDDFKNRHNSLTGIEYEDLETGLYMITLVLTIPLFGKSKSYSCLY